MQSSDIKRQLSIEEEYILKSQGRGIAAWNDTLDNARLHQNPKAYAVVVDAMQSSIKELEYMCCAGTRGTGGKYRILIRELGYEKCVAIAMHILLNTCVSPNTRMQACLTTIGKAIELELLIQSLDKVNPLYVKSTEEDLRGKKVFSLYHRYRTFVQGYENMETLKDKEYQHWDTYTRIGVAKIITEACFSSGLFKWVLSKRNTHRNTDYHQDVYDLEPDGVLKDTLRYLLDNIKDVVINPPMVCPPKNWTRQHSGGYLTDYYQTVNPMVKLRTLPKELRLWVYNGINKADEVMSALNIAQEVPYKVNHEVYSILRSAVSKGGGILGLPKLSAGEAPTFPLHLDKPKEEYSKEELDEFRNWKYRMAQWYKQKDKGTNYSYGLLGVMQELLRFNTEERLYFPAFVDWRGRLYFYPMIQPQARDAIKGCLDFANKKPLGKEGLFWLKVHCANSAGFDKETPELKAKWVDDNLEMLMHFADNPLEVDAPEPDTAFTLLQGLLDLKGALASQNPEEYLSSTPVAMDATCSGLQHFSALFRDEVGGYYTNVSPSDSRAKQDIYKKVAETAQSLIRECTDDPVVLEFWKKVSISRTMAKRPVMTYVYGSTLISTIDYVVEALLDDEVEPILDDEGKVLYSLRNLAVPCAKALRKAVELAVPKAAAAMHLMKKMVSMNKGNALRWYSPTGLPVVNFSAKDVIRRIPIRSMGVQALVFREYTDEYSYMHSKGGIAPNFVHSLDSAHLHRVLNNFDGDILPIHDSYATHPSDVSKMLKVIKEEFIKMYQKDIFKEFLVRNLNNEQLEEIKELIPQKGNLDLESVKNSTFFFC